jgi:hypothetical protein
MPRDLTKDPKKMQDLFDTLGDMHNPTSKQFVYLFAKHRTKPERFRTDDIILIGPEQSKFVKPNSATTVGIYIVNKFLLEPLEIFGYQNCVFDSKTWEKVESLVAEALMAKDLTTAQVAEFIDRCQYLLGGPLAHLINPSISSDIINLPPSAMALKKKLLEENKEAIEANDPQVSADIEEAVTKEALRVMEEKNDPSLSIFKSGAVDPYNNMKVMLVMKGAVADPTGESPTGYKVVTSDYNEGISKEDMPKIANAVVNSSYSSGVLTQDSGYMAKKYNVSGQRIKLLPKGSDCGSTDYYNIVVSSRHLYRYIMDGGKLVCLTPEVIDKYKGKMCKMRSPLHCHAKDPCYCNVCMGDRLYLVGVTNVGMTQSIISGATMNMSLKAKHDARARFYELSMDDLTKYVN